MFQKLLSRSLIFLLSLVFALAFAQEPLRVQDIRVEGLQKVEIGTVLATVPFRAGDEYTDEKSTSAIRALFQLGLFQDVRIKVDKGILTISVQEKPAIAEIQLVGIKEFDHDVIRKALKNAGLFEGRAFDKAILDRSEQEIKRQYLNRSMYATQVSTQVTSLEKNQVRLLIQVSEGAVAKISEIRIVGAQAFTKDALLEQMNQNTGNWLSWYTKSNRYSQSILNADIEALRSFYLKQGFVEFRIESTQVALSPDKSDVSITIHLYEGPRYVVRSVELQGEYLGRKPDFQSLVKINAGLAYNVEDVNATIESFKNRFAEFGYAFAQIEVRPELNAAKGWVDLKLRSDPGRRAYVRRIEIQGNNKTRDEVIRREFRQMESAWYDGNLIKLSRDRVDRLGFFTDVSIEHREVPSSPDQVDLVLKVTERSTGNLSVGAGYSQADKLSLMAGIQQENILGTGHYLGFNINTSNYNRELSLVHTNPYFSPSGISRSYELLYKIQRPYDEQGGEYKIVSKKAAVSFGVPFTETDKVFFGAGIESTDITSGSSMPLAYQEFIDRFGTPAVALPLTIGWSRDHRDSVLAPTEGRYHRVNVEIGAAGDTRYLKSTYQFQQYWPVHKKLTLAVNAELGWGEGLGKKPFPIFKNFYGGGLGSVRGFEQNTFGAKTTVSGSSDPIFIGGNEKYLLNLEAIFPFPGAGNDKSIRWFTFLDAGTIQCPSSLASDCSADGLRMSTGLGLSWISPIGPLRFAWTKVLKKEPTDLPQRLQFQIGTNF